MSGKVDELICNTWDELVHNLRVYEEKLEGQDDGLWYRGCSNCQYALLPSLLRATTGLSRGDHEQFEQDAFFEFQARAVELRRQALTDWELLFYARHFTLPTRVLDWTDTFGTAVYFATENWRPDANRRPTIWLLNPYSLNEETLGNREIILPKYLGLKDDEFWDFGELLAADGSWGWKGPVAVFPIQINDRVRAQRGWFTVHGDDRRALDEQFPKLVAKLILTPNCVASAREFLKLAGLNRFSIYPDLENLSNWITAERSSWAERRKGKKSKSKSTGERKIDEKRRSMES